MRRGYVIVTKQYFEIDDFADLDEVARVAQLAQQAEETARDIIGAEVSRVVIGISRKPGPGSSSSGSNITAMESSVLDQVVNGYSNRDIGGLLGITEATVKVHMRSAMKKLNVNNRTKAALAWQQRAKQKSAEAA